MDGSPRPARGGFRDLRARKETRDSRQPRRPHMGQTGPSGSTRVCPISPGAVLRPRPGQSARCPGPADAGAVLDEQEARGRVAADLREENLGQGQGPHVVVHAGADSQSLRKGRAEADRPGPDAGLAQGGSRLGVDAARHAESGTHDAGRRGGRSAQQVTGRSRDSLGKQDAGIPAVRFVGRGGREVLYRPDSARQIGYQDLQQVRLHAYPDQKAGFRAYAEEYLPAARLSVRGRGTRLLQQALVQHLAREDGDGGARQAQVAGQVVAGDGLVPVDQAEYTGSVALP